MCYDAVQYTHYTLQHYGTPVDAYPGLWLAAALPPPPRPSSLGLSSPHTTAGRSNAGTCLRAQSSAGACARVFWAGATPVCMQRRGGGPDRSTDGDRGRQRMAHARGGARGGWPAAGYQRSRLAGPRVRLQGRAGPSHAALTNVHAANPTYPTLPYPVLGSHGGPERAQPCVCRNRQPSSGHVCIDRSGTVGPHRTAPHRTILAHPSRFAIDKDQIK